MSRISSALAAAAVLALIAPNLQAQEKPTPAMLKAIAGTWTLDSARSDSIPAGLAAMVNPLAGRAGPDPSTAAGQAAAGGGGGRRGGGGAGAAGRGGARGMGGAGNTRVFLQEFRSLPTMELQMTETATITMDATRFETTWKTDGKKHPVAQMEGGVIEFYGAWKGKTLILEKTIPNNGSVKREFKSLGENELEVKVQLTLGKRKLEQKVVYVRAPAGQ